MPQNEITYKRGRLAELRAQRNELKIQIDVIVKGIITHFDPLDLALDYVDEIDPTRLKIYVRDIERKIADLRKVRAEIERLKEEVGENGAT